MGVDAIQEMFSIGKGMAAFHFLDYSVGQLRPEMFIIKG
jgi:hypothetical protein